MVRRVYGDGDVALKEDKMPLLLLVWQAPNDPHGIIGLLGTKFIWGGDCVGINDTRLGLFDLLHLILPKMLDSSPGRHATRVHSQNWRA